VRGVPDPLLNVRDLYAGYGSLIVVRGVSFSVDEGTTTLILGLNGAGKTTTLKAIAGIVKPVRGSIIFNRKNITGWPPHARAREGIVMITDNPVFPNMSVADNIKLAASPRYYRDPEEAVKEALGYFTDLAKLANLKASALSGGQRKMLAMAMAMVARPRLLLLDEPSTGLSPVMVLKVISYVRKLKEMGITILLAEQNPSFIELADHVMVLEMGRVKLYGAADEIGKLEEVRRTFFQVT
jgi:ABC-type branched-chain amino acid transport systems, ATPase component